MAHINITGHWFLHDFQIHYIPNINWKPNGILIKVIFDTDRVFEQIRGFQG